MEEEEEEWLWMRRRSGAHQHRLRKHGYDVLGQANKAERKPEEAGTWHWATWFPPLMNGKIQIQKRRAMLTPWGERALFSAQELRWERWEAGTTRGNMQRTNHTAVHSGSG